MTRLGLRLFALTLVSWTLCFAALRHLGTWAPFAFVGIFLATFSLSQHVVPRALLKPSRASVAAGVAAGALMVVATHLAFRVIVTLSPVVAAGTGQLLHLLNVTGFSSAVRSMLIVLIASCEEVTFRGLLPASSSTSSTRPHWPSHRERKQILAFAVAYALTTLPLGSPLLVLCALTCGSLWGLMRIATGSLVVPLLAHVIWDLGVLVVWPLVDLAS